MTDVTGVLIPARKAAELLGVDISTLRRWRAEKRGPKWYRTGYGHGRVKYDIEDIVRFMEGEEHAEGTDLPADQR